MAENRTGSKRAKKFGVAAVAAAAAGGASLLTTAVCSCYPVAHAVLDGSIRMEAPVLQRLAERRFPAGIAEAEVIRRIRAPRRERYCAQRNSGKHLACALPYVKNFWMASHVELELVFDAKRELASVTAKPVVRYIWQ